MKRSSAIALDASALLVSGLCLLHCLALPLLVALSPLFGLWAEQEWVHGVLAAVAVPVTATALWRAQRRRPLPIRWVLLAGCGLASLLLGAAGWPWANIETPATVAGALSLATVHIWHWLRHARR